MINVPRPSPSVFGYCKQSKTGRWEGLGTRLQDTYFKLQSLPAPSKYHIHKHLGIGECMKATHLVLGAWKIHSFVHTSGYGLYLYAHVISSCARQVKFGYYHGNELLMIFMHIATKVHESDMVRTWNMQFCAYFRLWTILVCSCDQSHEQDRLNFTITMATSYDFMDIATKVHESQVVRISTMHSHT